MQDHEHAHRTQRHQYRYLFTAKHHGGAKKAAQWLPSLSEDEEFAVFDGADEMELSDEDGNLYGAIHDGEGSLRHLGYWKEQIAEYPRVAEGVPWHGYPVWPLNEGGPPSRRNQRHRPAREVFYRMVDVGLITIAMRNRLMGGHHV